MKKSANASIEMKKMGGQLRTYFLQSPAKSVGMKLFLIFFCCIIAMVAIVGFYSYSQSKRIIESKMSLSINETITQTSSKLDWMLKSYEDFSMQFLTDKTFLTSIEEYRTLTETFQRFKSGSAINERMASFTYSNRDLAAITLIPLYPNEVISTNTSLMKWDEFDKEPWMQAVKDGDGRAIWLPTKPEGYVGNSNSGATFGIARMISGSTSAQKDYVLLIEFRADTLDTLKEIKIGETGKVFVVDSGNGLVFTPEPEQIGKPWNIELSKEQRSESAERSLSTTVSLDQEDTLVSFKQLTQNNWMIATTVPVAELVKESRTIFDVTIGSIVIAALVAAAIGVFVIRMIGKPLMTLRNLMKEGAQGNLTVRSRHTSKDEIGQLSDSFNQMMEQITGLVRQTNNSAAEVLATAEQLLTSSKQTATSAREIAVATEEIANGASSLAVEAEKGSNLTMDIGYKVTDVVTASEQMGVSASEVHTATMQGVTYMVDLTGKTNEVERITRTMVEKVDALKESTTSIRRILDVLNNMTKQTNILSLNATIEAARAGAAGKGFAVVADEIRQLAEQSRQSIDVVGTITEQILNQIEETLSVMGEAYPLFQAQNQSVKDAESIFNQVQTRMTDFAKQLGGVSDAVLKLNEAQNVLSETMTNVSAVSEESSATSEEVASLSGEQLHVSDNLVQLSERLEQLSDTLRDTLKTFRME